MHKTSDGTRIEDPSRPARGTSDTRLKPELVGASEGMREVRLKIAEAAAADVPVMILGEVGAGKDVVARALHDAGNRRGEFVKICFRPLPDPLLESELFGHEAGAFMGARRRKPGRLEMAINGSAYLDEITDLPTHIQAKLLEALERDAFLRLGSATPIRMPRSFYSASSVPLDRLLNEEVMLGVLFRRLSQCRIEIPPLRERAEDIPDLARLFLMRCGRKLGRLDLTVSPDFMARLTRYDWPGNVRELEGVIHHYALTQDESLTLHEEDGAKARRGPFRFEGWHSLRSERQRTSLMLWS